MKKLLACIACCSLSALIGAAGDAGKTPKVEGAWNVTGGSIDGEKLSKDFIEKTMFVYTFKDGKYTLHGKGRQQVQAGTYKLEAKGKAVNLKLTVTEGEGKGQVLPCLMKLEGDVLTLAVDVAEKQSRPPEDFEGGKDITVMIMKRGK